MTGELWDLRAVVEGFSRSRAISSEAQENEESAKPISIQLETKKPSSPAPKSAKKRKSPPKKVVCELPADALSDCVWAWRKYGQKPIKDSPYPRGYYRCSSSKGCPARKQVERSRTKAGYFVVVYTGEHNHAAPVHRQRSPPQFSARDAGDGGGGAATSPPTPSAGEPNIPPPAVEEVEREKGEMDKLSDDDFIFMDLDLLIDSDADGFFADDLFGGSGDAWPQRIAGS